MRLELADTDYRLVSALNGTQGIQLAEEIKPDLILLDILMPGKDGWTVLAELKKHPGSEVNSNYCGNNVRR